jgi:hypothetical protein
MKKIKKTKVNSINSPNLVSIQNKREKIKKGLKRVDKKILNPSPDYSKNLKNNKIKKNKLNSNPLFIKFLNWTGDKYSIEDFLNNIKDNVEDESDCLVIESKISNLDDEYLNNLSIFQDYFKKNIIETINNKNISDFFLGWLSNCFSYIEEKKENYLYDEKRTVKIKDPQGRWFESIVCYNFVMTFNYFGLDIIKQCPVCLKMFCHKGPYAKYCGEGCKESGSNG